MAGDELGEVAPMRADVGEGARRSAEVGVDAPVVVLGSQQPVLEVGAVDEVDGTALAGADTLLGLADRGVVAVDERDGGDGAALGGLRQPGGARQRRPRLAASRRRRGARRRARRRRAPRAGGSACRHGRRQRCRRRAGPRRPRSRARRRAGRQPRASARGWKPARRRPCHPPRGPRERGRRR